MSNTENTPKLSDTQQFELAKLKMQIRTMSKDKLEELVNQLFEDNLIVLNQNKLLSAKILDLQLGNNSTFSFETDLKQRMGLD